MNNDVLKTFGIGIVYILFITLLLEIKSLIEIYIA